MTDINENEKKVPSKAEKTFEGRNMFHISRLW